MRFEVRGSFKTQEGWQRFTKVVEANNEKYAVEKVYSLVGSNHKVKRNLIKIEEVKQA
ncbi:MAG: 50S ribosomal protein L18a [Archaeoglobus sp.]|uniref:50S ribosomal protein L18Ae n=1 Tax=Archaeoglobus sp. TaxID=1872626 RepID=UPI001D20B0BE|nr:50S ribosomal protein L18Ae [Archaeoglobus sp.]MBO8179507.1 50S ribosomal protein L18a [Archaeoglobus sp.]